MSINMSLLNDFIEEAGEHLDEMESLLLQLAEEPSSLDILNDIFRTVHNIKGGSQLTGLEKVSSLAHRLEDLLDLLRQGQMASEQSIVELLIAGRDRIVRLVEELEESQQELSPVEDLLERLGGLLAEAESGTAVTQEPPQEGEAAAGRETDGVFEEEHDGELFAIFSGHLQEQYEILRDEVLRLQDQPGTEADLSVCAEAIRHLRSSANYMGYEELVGFYDSWLAEVEACVQHAGESTLDFMRQRLERLAQMFPLLQPIAGRESVPTSQSSGSVNENTDDVTAAVLEAFREKEAEDSKGQINLSLLDDFIEEAGEHLDEMESLLLQLAEEPSSLDILNDIFRTVHNIKGGSQLTGLEKVSSLAHRLEDLLDLLRQGQMASEQSIVELLIAGRDRIVRLVEELEESQQELSPVEDLLERLGGLLAEAESGTAVTQEPPQEGEAAAGRETDGVFEEEHDGELFAIFSGHLQEQYEILRDEVLRLQDQPGTEADLSVCAEAIRHLRSSANYMGYEELVGFYDSWLAEVEACVQHAGESTLDFMRQRLERLAQMFPLLDSDAPPLESVGMEERKSGETTNEKALSGRLHEALETALQKVSESEQQTLHDVYDMMVSSQPQENGVTAKRTSVVTQQQAGRTKQQNTDQGRERKIRKSIRVDAEKIDALMNQVGELVVDRSYFFQLFNEMRELQQYLKEKIGVNQKDLKNIRAFTYRLSEAISGLGRTSNELQEGVMKMRMLPISHIFKRYPRLVHDLTRNIDKKVNLVLKGEETELDKMIVEELSDPMIHIIRNAIDHGLETVEERKRLGKPEAGKLVLEAYQESNHIIVEISDDGRGIDLEKIREIALKRGICTQDELERMSQRELMNLILTAGFSTAKKITNTSGRGVGMDVVKRNIEKINGTLEIDSQPGKGTRMRLKIPLTLAIIHALMVRVGSDIYTIPLANVDETVRINQEDTSTAEGVEIIYLRGTALPIFRLSKLFKVRGDEDDKSFVVIVSTNGQRIGFVVDELVGQQEVVIKPLADYVQDKSGFSGATIIGDGHISLILDVYELIKMTTSRQIKMHKEHAARLRSKITAASATSRELTGHTP